MHTLTESLQDYLIAIYKIIIETNGVRVKNIAKRLGVKNSSVVSALRSLTKSGHINYEPYGIISLTPKGNKTARQLTEKNRVLRLFLERVLGLDRKTAAESACSMEHAIPEETFKRFTQLIKYIDITNKNDPAWLEGFKEFYLNHPVDLNCEDCIEKYVNNAAISNNSHEKKT